ncbi:hypothetical protein PR202_gb23526 [Eleusine coracana subsp. coracana]|uniref:UspA domain-containing protein n=1 Tax=Eleusine coracana subsp. coracana TaxID=191504 RepID=A0AAV5FGH9_ELECO|nr:hypothetical protein PR202_gb23526 [Eleusine coracana subsp. coracana]
MPLPIPADQTACLSLLQRPGSSEPPTDRCRRWATSTGMHLRANIAWLHMEMTMPVAGAADVVSFVEADLKRSSMRVIKKAKDLCMQVSDATFEVVEGDARNVLCEAVEKHRAELLVVGSHGYGAIKRPSLGSTSLATQTTEDVRESGSSRGARETWAAAGEVFRAAGGSGGGGRGRRRPRRQRSRWPSKIQTSQRSSSSASVLELLLCRPHELHPVLEVTGQHCCSIR